MVSASGIIVIAELMGREPSIPLGMPGRSAVRVCRPLGFPAAERWEVNACGARDGLESYLVQMWRLPDEADAKEPHEDV